MKTEKILLLLMAFLIFTLYSCSGVERTDVILYSNGIQNANDVGHDSIFAGRHELRKMSSFDDIKTHYYGYEPATSSGWWFLFFGSRKSTSGSPEHSYNISNTMVRFSWLGNDSAYTISEFPREYIRVKLDTLVTTPYIIFSKYNDLAFNSKFEDSDREHNYFTRTYYYEKYNQKSEEIETEIFQGNHHYPTSFLFDLYVKEIIVVCHPNDWPEEIQVPD